MKNEFPNPDELAKLINEQENKDKIESYDEINCVCGRNMDDFFMSEDFKTADWVSPHQDSRIDFGDEGATIYKCSCGRLYYFSEGGLGFYSLPINYLDEDYNLDNNHALLVLILKNVYHLERRIVEGHGKRYMDYDYLKAIVLQEIQDIKREIEEKAGIWRETTE